MLKVYTIHEIKKSFPSCNFEYLNDAFLLSIAELVQGRFVGGIVRDSLLNITNKDIDIATPLLPHEVMKILCNYKPVPTGIEYGTVSIFYKNYQIEITSLRKDVENFGRRAQVIFQGDWQSDSERRDFTFNSLFYFKDHIYDYQNGIEDLKNGHVHFIGDAAARIKEDYLRILRFIRFFMRYSKTDSYKEYENILRELCINIKILSIERVLMEIKNILKHQNWRKGVKIINELNISNILWHQCLNIEEGEFTEEEKLYIIFYKYPLNILNNIPFTKQEKKFLTYFSLIITHDNIENIVQIWKKTQSFDLLKQMLLFKDKINNMKKYHNLINISEEDFILYRHKYSFKYYQGIERGEEENICKQQFLCLYIK